MMKRKIKTVSCSICKNLIALTGELYFEKVKRSGDGTGIIVKVWCVNCELKKLNI